MATDPNKTVFISYRRAVSRHLARSIYMDLTHNGYDVFLDVSTIDNGAFDSVILNQIGARTHFVVLLSAGALERCQHADDWLRREIEEALSLKRNITFVIEQGCNFDREIAYLPKEWQDEFKLINRVRLFDKFFNDGMGRLCKSYLSTPSFHVNLYPISPNEHDEVNQRKAQLIDLFSQEKIGISQKVSVLDILPQPFSWVDIPSGEVTLMDEEFGKFNYRYTYLNEPTKFYVTKFQIAKYPITNAQFDVFINHLEGYQNPIWWQFSVNASGWRQKHQNSDKLKDSRDIAPRHNVTWYEAVAFCLWLSEMTGEKIMLPTEQQWQRAAQGDDGRKYPWGNELDKNRCNYNHIQNDLTPVTQYEGKGDSPFGVVDMAGNIWEWCVTEAHHGWCNLSGIGSRISRGGTQEDYNLNRCLPNTYRNLEIPASGFHLGFRIACSPSP